MVNNEHQICDLQVNVMGADDEESAAVIARSVAASSLTKVWLCFPFLHISFLLFVLE
jgi:hypothetical protein